MDWIFHYYGIDRSRFQSLFSLFRKLALRGGKSTRHQSGLRILLVVYAFISLMISFTIVRCQDAFTAFLFSLAYSSVMALFSVIMEFGAIVISPDDYLILGHLPVNERTFFAAKIANLGWFVLIISLAMNSFSSLVLAYKYGWAALPLFFGVGLFANLFAMLLIISLYCLAIRYFPMERVRDLLTYLQLGLNFLIIFANQNLVRLVSRLGKRSLETFGWIKWLPPAWFAEMDLLILGKYQTGRLLLAILPLFVTLLLLRWTLKRFSLTYAGYLQTLRETDRTVEKRPVIEGVLGLFRQDPQEAAVSGLVLRYLARDREMRLRILPLFGVMLANGFFFFRGFPGGPAGGTGNGWASVFPVFILGWMILMFLPSIGVNLTISEDWRSSWAFWVTPLRGRTVVRGVRLALMVMMYLPLFLLNVFVLCLRFPFYWAVLHVIPIAAGGMAFVAVVNTMIAAPPLSQEKQTGKNTGMNIIWMASGVLLAGVIVSLERICFQSVLGAMLLLVSLFIGLWSAWRLEEKVLDRKLLESEYEG